MPFAHDDGGVLPAHGLREVGALAVYTTAQGSSELRLNTGLPAIARGRGWVTTSKVAPGALVLQQKSGKLGKRWHGNCPASGQPDLLEHLGEHFGIALVGFLTRPV